MPIKPTQKKSFKEVKVYTLKRLLKRRQKYGGSDREPEEYEKLQSIFFAKNLNPFKVLDRGVLTEANLQEALNELEIAGLINISDENRLTLTTGGVKVAERIRHISNLNEINDQLFVKGSIMEDPGPAEPSEPAEPEIFSVTEEPIDIEPIEPELPEAPTPRETNTIYKCRNCGHEVNEPKNFCPRCGEVIEVTQRCPICSNLNEPGSAFCIKCGTRLSR